MPTIYAIGTAEQPVVYVGRTSRTMEQRFEEHKTAAAIPAPGPFAPVHQWMAAQPEGTVICTVLEVLPDDIGLTELTETEAAWIYRLALKYHAGTAQPLLNRTLSKRWQYAHGVHDWTTTQAASGA